MTQLSTRDTQTEVKHRILESYLGHWSGIIMRGITGKVKDFGPSFKRRFVYVDGFSYKGRYLGNTADVMMQRTVSEPTWGSPVIGVRALDRAHRHAQDDLGFHLETFAVLFEKDPEHFTDLLESLEMAGLKQRLVVNPQRIAPKEGQIVVVHDDFLKHVDEVLELVGDRYSNGFFLLDPWGPTGIPYAEVRKVITHDHVDVMINLMYQELHKKQGILVSEAGTPVTDKIIRNFDLMYGTEEWRTIANDTRQDTHQMEKALSQFYLQRLQVADPSLAVKNIRLEFPDRDRTMMYLFLTTHDPTGALTLNKILYDAKQAEKVLKWDYGQAKWVHRTRSTGQTTLFDFANLDTAPAAQSPIRNTDTAKLADDIWFQFFDSRQSTKRAVYKFLTDSDFFPQEIDNALTYLKRRGLVEYRDLRLDTPIIFCQKEQRR